MVVTTITNYVVFGTTSDTKPLAGIATNTLFFEIDSGRVYKFTGGVWSLFSGDNKPETLTNKTLSIPNISQIKNGTATLTLPTTTDTLLGRSTTDTLSNKTLITPTIATINNGGVITLPSGTRTLVARDTADTLLNKTININSNTITANSQAAGDILINNGTQFIRLARGTNGQVLTSTATTIQWAAAAGGGGGLSASSPNTFTAVQTFNDSMLAIRNPANTFSVTVNAGSQTANRTFTFPVTNTDTIQTLAATQTPTNKTLNIDQNTIKHSTTNAAGDLLVGNGTQFTRLARGTANQVLAVNGSGTDIAWAAASGGGSGLANASAYSYLFYKNGSTYTAYNIKANTVDATSTTDAGTVMNTIVTNMNTAGGGLCFVYRGIYVTTTSVTLKNNCGFIGEERDTTIIRVGSNVAGTFRYSAGTGNQLANFTLRDLTLEWNNLNGDNTGETDTPWFSTGTKNCTFENIKVVSRSHPSVAKIPFWLDTVNRTNNNDYVRAYNCWFEGDAGGQDTFGCGAMNYCDVSHNTFINLTSQGIGIGATYYSKYNDNTFINTGNAIGFENDCHDNEIANNICYNTTGIKISEEGSANTNLSRNNHVHGNTLMYGESGIEAGISTYDTIENNKIYRTDRNGIRGSFYGAKILGNHLVDTNAGNFSQTVNGATRTIGGIVMVNNTTPLPDCDFNQVENNTFVDTGVAYTDPTTSTSKSSNTGGIILDTTYDNAVLTNNRFIGLVVTSILDFGTNTYRLDFDGANSLNLGARIWKMKGSDGGFLNLLESTGQSAPNQSWDFFANYTKQVGATFNPFTFGYNSDISTMEWWSKWSGTNKVYFAVTPSSSTISFNNATVDFNNNWLINTQMNGVKWNLTTKTASYTAVDQDVVILCDTTSAAITITLPAASGRAGKFYIIHRKAGTTNAITIDPNASELIDGSTTIVVPTTAGSSKWIVCDGTAWYSK